jgi:predicted DNA-binding transcriptional regulator AlpA
LLTVKTDLSYYLSMRTYSTVQAVKKLGIGRDTLYRWIRGLKVAAPKRTEVGGVRIRLWTDADIKKVRAYMKQSYRKKMARS